MSCEFSIMSVASGGFAPRAPPLDPAGGLLSPRPPVPHPLHENPGSATVQPYINDFCRGISSLNNQHPLRRAWCKSLQSILPQSLCDVKTSARYFVSFQSFTCFNKTVHLVTGLTITRQLICRHGHMGVRGRNEVKFSFLRHFGCPTAST